MMIPDRFRRVSPHFGCLVQLLHAYVAAGVASVSVSVSAIVRHIVTVAVVGAVDIAVSVALVVDLGVVGVSELLYHCVEAIVVIGGVLHHSGGAIRFLEGVAALDLVAIPRLPLALLVSGVGILDAVVELVLGIVMGLVLVVSVSVARMADTRIAVSVDATVSADHIVIVSVAQALVDGSFVLGHRTVAGGVSTMGSCPTGSHQKGKEQTSAKGFHIGHLFAVFQSEL